MSINGAFLKTFRGLTVAMLAVLAWSNLLEQGLAQTGIETPFPSASPYSVVSPSGNPNRLAPMPIGPAPYPMSYGQPFAPWPAYYSAYPPAIYPAAPYWGRPATPFEFNGTVSPQQIRPIETQMLSKQAGDRQFVAAPFGNLRLTISESFLNRLVARTEQKPGDIRDFILGAQVSGHQTTETKLQFDLLPEIDKMKGALVLTGITQSQTTGVTPQATVDVASQQNFVAVKEIYFDGLSFSTRHATVQVQAKNQTLGASTPLSGTLFGGIADRIAYREAERRKSAAEAIARDRVAERVYPEFDREIDKQLANANDQLEGTVRRNLRVMNLMPSKQQVSSTDTGLTYYAQMGEELPTASTLALEKQISKEEAVCMFLHESFLNALVANSGLKGLKTTDKEIKAIFAPYEVGPAFIETNKSETAIQLPAMENMITNIEFADVDPLTFRMEQGRVFVTLRASFKPAGQDLIPPLAVTILYETELSGSKILVSPGNVQVALLSKNEDDATPPIALKLVTQGIEASLSKLAFDRALPANLWPFGGAVPQVSNIRSQDGWAAISIR